MKYKMSDMALNRTQYTILSSWLLQLRPHCWLTFKIYFSTVLNHQKAFFEQIPEMSEPLKMPDP